MARDARASFIVRRVDAVPAMNDGSENQKQPGDDVRAAFDLVAGVGFEPTTFRL